MQALRQCPSKSKLIKPRPSPEGRVYWYQANALMSQMAAATILAKWLGGSLPALGVAQ